MQQQLKIRRDGVDIHLVSRTAPEREAQKLVASLEPAKVFIQFGWGLGHVDRELRQRFPEALRICFEPEEDWQTRIPSGNIQGLHLLPSSQAEEGVRQVLERHYSSLLLKELRLVALPGYARAFAKEWQGLVEFVQTWMEGLGQDLRIQAQFGARWLENSLRNLSHWASSSLSLGKSSGVWVFGAGPSAHEGIRELAARRTGDLILAADTVFPVLASAGISPNLVCTLDANWFSSLHPRWTDTAAIPWLVDGSVDPGFLRGLGTSVPMFGKHPVHQIFVQEGLPESAFRPSYRNVGEWILDIGTRLRPGRQPRVFGLDGAYPAYRSYLPGTYRDHVDLSQNSRLEPRDSLDFRIMSRGQSGKLKAIPGAYQHQDLSAPQAGQGIAALSPFQLPDYSGFNWKQLKRRVTERLIEAWKLPMKLEEASLHAECAALLPGALKLKLGNGGANADLEEVLDLERLRMRELLVELERSFP